MTTHGLTPLIVSNEPLLRALRDGGHATGRALAETARIDSKHINRQLELLTGAGLIHQPFGAATHEAQLTGAGISALAALDRAGQVVGGNKRRGSASVARFRPNPHNPRKSFDPADLRDLADSYAERGVLQALRVTPPDGDGVMMILIGERRWRAAGLCDAGLDIQLPYTVDADPRASDPASAATYAIEMALVENGQRADLTKIEEARAYVTLLDADPTLKNSARALARRLGRAHDDDEGGIRTIQKMVKVAREADPADIVLFERGYDEAGQPFGWNDLVATVQRSGSPQGDSAPQNATQHEPAYSQHVYNGIDYGNATMAAEARARAEGRPMNSGPSPSRDAFSEQIRESAREVEREERDADPRSTSPQGGGATQNAPSRDAPKRDMTPRETLAMLEFANKLHTQGYARDGREGRFVAVHEYWTKPTFLALQGELGLIGVTGVDAYLTPKGEAWLEGRMADDDELADARFAAGENAPARSSSEPEASDSATQYVTAWLNVPPRSSSEGESLSDSATQNGAPTAEEALAMAEGIEAYPAEYRLAAFRAAWAACGLTGPLIVSDAPTQTGVIFDEHTHDMVMVADKHAELADAMARARAETIAWAVNFALMVADESNPQGDEAPRSSSGGEVRHDSAT